jgi:hypothetical protein
MSARQAALGESRPLSPFVFERACCLPVHSLGSGPLLLWSADGNGIVELVDAHSRCTRRPSTASRPDKKYSAVQSVEWLADG